VIAEVVTIGDEVCRGEIVDSNAAFLASSLWELDVTTAWMSSCRDVADDMRSVLERACERSDLVITTGGLGPTLDDLTVDVVAAMVGAEPVIDPESKSKMDRRTQRAKYVAPNMERQVRVPRGARVYLNPTGLAPCFEVSYRETPIICLPGPPRELKPIFNDQLAARIVEMRESRGERIERIARRIYRVFGRGESQVAGLIDGVVDETPGASLHFQVKYPEVLVKVVVRDSNAEVAGGRLEDIESRLRSALGHYLYGIDDDTLPVVVGRCLQERNLTLATAESCTGGLIGSLLTDVPGSSGYYLGGAITYSNQEKVRQLGVESATLDTHGAVSEECVIEMANGMRDRCGADIAVAVSGIAGPSGGTEDKPVGTVWLAVSGPGEYRKTRLLTWPSSRAQIRTLSAHAALAMVLAAASGSEGEAAA
jgi:nicotinamide-nucleotide amidase